MSSSLIIPGFGHSTAIQLHVSCNDSFLRDSLGFSNDRQLVLESAADIAVVLGAAVVLADIRGRIDQARKLQALSGRTLAPRQRMIPASFSALGRASQAFPDHQLGNIVAFRLQHTAVPASVAIEGAPSLPAFTRNYCEVEAATGNNLAQALRRLSCNGPLRCTASLKARLRCVESEQADLPSMAANHDGVAIHNLDCSRLDRVGGCRRGNARQGQGEE